MAFSTDGSDNLPLTSLKLGAKPCKDPTLQSATDRSYYPTEFRIGSYCETDERYVHSGLQIAEEGFMAENAIKGIISNRPSSRNFMQYWGARDKNEIMTWNRPTAPWSLQCELEGKSREVAFEKASLQLILTGQEVHIANSGIAILVCLGVLCLCNTCGTVCTAGKLLPVTVGIFACCPRVFWIIVGPIIMSALADCNSGLVQNFSIA